VTGIDLYYEYRESHDPLWASLPDEIQRRWDRLSELFDQQWQDGFDTGYEQGHASREDGK
jgi:hypothetical protein